MQLRLLRTMVHLPLMAWALEEAKLLPWPVPLSLFIFAARYLRHRTFYLLINLLIWHNAPRAETYLVRDVSFGHVHGVSWIRSSRFKLGRCTHLLVLRAHLTSR